MLNEENVALEKATKLQTIAEDDSILELSELDPTSMRSINNQTPKAPANGGITFANKKASLFSSPKPTNSTMNFMPGVNRQQNFPKQISNIPHRIKANGRSTKHVSMNFDGAKPQNLSVAPKANTPIAELTFFDIVKKITQIRNNLKRNNKLIDNHLLNFTKIQETRKMYKLKLRNLYMNFLK